MNFEQQLKDELERLDAQSIEIIYSEDSRDEYELSYQDFETQNLDIKGTLQSFQGVPDRAGSDVAWSLIKEHKKSLADNS